MVRLDRCAAVGQVSLAVSLALCALSDLPSPSNLNLNVDSEPGFKASDKANIFCERPCVSVVGAHKASAAWRSAEVWMATWQLWVSLKGFLCVYFTCHMVTMGSLRK